MRVLIPAALLLLAACAPRPAPTPPPAQPAAPIATTIDRHDHSTLNGMSANDLVEHFGRPRLQVREGDGTRLQFAGPGCFLDAYLYPSASGQGVPRVTHVDARNARGSVIDPRYCVALIERR